MKMQKERQFSEILIERAWDSNHFGFPIFDLNSNSLKGEDNECLQELVARESGSLLECRCSSKDFGLWGRLTGLGFNLSEVRVDLGLEIQSYGHFTSTSRLLLSGYTFELASSSNISEYVDLVNQIPFSTRFTRGGVFDPVKGREMYRIWVERSLKGEFDHFVYGVRDRGALIGLCTIRRLADSEFRIGLFGLSELAMGIGLSSSFIGEILRREELAGWTKIAVATQAENIGAIRAYERSGFRVLSIELLWQLVGDRLQQKASNKAA